MKGTWETVDGSPEFRVCRPEKGFISPRREYSTQSRKAWVEMRGALVATLLFDVLSQYFDSHSACTNQAVGAMPEYRLPVDAAQMLSELLADEPGRDSFQVVDQLAQLNRRVRLKKQVDMISFAIELDQFGTPFLKRLLNDHSQSFEHLPGDRFTAIFSHQN
jgi:hypothetical protein